MISSNSPFSFPLQLMEAFVDEYFDQNPISQVCSYSHEFCDGFTLNCVKTSRLNAADQLSLLEILGIKLKVVNLGLQQHIVITQELSLR